MSGALPGHKRDHDYYLDIGEYIPGQNLWRAEDHYPDLEVRTNRGVELSDVDELLVAVRHRLLKPEVAKQAVHHAVDAIDGLSRHGYDLRHWLTAPGMDLTWREHASDELS